MLLLRVRIFLSVIAARYGLRHNHLPRVSASSTWMGWANAFHRRRAHHGFWETMRSATALLEANCRGSVDR